jgi:hypothetical protein
MCGITSPARPPKEFPVKENDHGMDAARHASAGPDLGADRDARPKSARTAMPAAPVLQGPRAPSDSEPMSLGRVLVRRWQPQRSARTPYSH